MNLTKKHFKEIANILNKNRYNSDGEFRGELLQDLSNYFKTLNPKFDEVKFKEACLK